MTESAIDQFHACLQAMDRMPVRASVGREYAEAIGRELYPTLRPRKDGTFVSEAQYIRDLLKSIERGECTLYGVKLEAGWLLMPGATSAREHRIVMRKKPLIVNRLTHATRATLGVNWK